MSKTINTAVSGVGVLVLLPAILQVLSLEDGKSARENPGHLDLDLALLRFSSLFAFLYLCLTVVTGAFFDGDAAGAASDFPGELHVANGAVEAAQAVLQMAFFMELKNKVMTVCGRISSLLSLT